jgi:hypothetical protein
MRDRIRSGRWSKVCDEVSNRYGKDGKPLEVELDGEMGGGSIGTDAEEGDEGPRRPGVGIRELDRNVARAESARAERTGQAAWAKQAGVQPELQVKM